MTGARVIMERVMVGFLVIIGLCDCATTVKRVEGLPGIGRFQEKVYAGYFEVNKEYGAHLYYYFVESQSNPLTDPTVLWLQGGPGCSSLFGAFVENGPHIIDANGNFNNNSYSWNTKANMLWIDQPVGSGYSYVENSDGYVTTEKTMAVELYSALTQFFAMLPQYNKNFYVFGESYAGKYIPSLCHYIWKQNQQKPKVFLNLKGIAMGDGWVYPYYQTGSYAPFLYANNLINEVELDLAELDYEAYKALIDAGLDLLADDAGNILLTTLAGDLDVYDIRYTNGDPTDPLADALGDYLNEPAVQKLMNAGDQTWTMCGNDAYFGLLDDLEQSVANLLPDLLTTYPVMNYNGNMDLICNYFGTNEWTKHIGWPGQQTYNKASNHTWIVDGTAAGYYKSGGNLTHLIIDNAGHMAPFSQPKNTQNMLYTFIAGAFKP